MELFLLQVHRDIKRISQSYNVNMCVRFVIWFFLKLKKENKYKGKTIAKNYCTKRFLFHCNFQMSKSFRCFFVVLPYTHTYTHMFGEKEFF